MHTIICFPPLLQTIGRKPVADANDTVPVFPKGDSDCNHKLQENVPLDPASHGQQWSGHCCKSKKEEKEEREDAYMPMSVNGEATNLEPAPVPPLEPSTRYLQLKKVYECAADRDMILCEPLTSKHLAT